MNRIKQKFFYRYFNVGVDVKFNQTFAVLSKCQNDNFCQLDRKLEELTPSVLSEITKYYFEAYPDYFLGWSIGSESSKEFMQVDIEKYLPKPEPDLSIDKYITPLSIYMPDDKNCEEGYLGIYFDCTWDINNSLGVVVRNWKVERVGTGQVAFLY